MSSSWFPRKRTSPAIIAGLFVLLACGERPEQRRASSGDVSLPGEPTRGALWQDALVKTADSLIAIKRPWRATSVLAPRLVTPATAPAEYRLVGARAAAAWSGWAEVQRILENAPWLDSQFGGEGRALLAESLLERGSNAIVDARAALVAAPERDRGRREVLLARAFDRANTRDSASRHYTSAAALLPAAKDWLALRAAGVTDDSAGRVLEFRDVREPAARARIVVTDAIARERARDFFGAAFAYRRAGMEPAAFRMDVLQAKDAAAKTLLSQKIVRYLAAAHSSGDVRASLQVLDSLATISPQDELTVARAATAAGINARAAAGFGRAGVLADRERMSYAGVLAKLGKTQEALSQYAAISDTQRAPLAAYQRARLTAQGGGPTAKAALESVAKQFAGKMNAAAPALLFLADLQVDDGNRTGAIETLRELTTRYPTSSQAPLGMFRLGALEWSDQPERAASVFDSVVARYPKEGEALAARYWSARAYDAAGKHSVAEQRWKQIVADAPMHYYAILSRQRLHAPDWKAPRTADTVSAKVNDPAVTRALLLQDLGLDQEAGFEREAISQRSTATVAESESVVTALLQAGDRTRAISLALAAVDGGKSSPVLLSAAFPLAQEDALVDESRRNKLDPYLVAGLIRQESGWNPRAQSAAGALGLMQLIPRVGAAIAASKKYPLWNQALLFQPDVSIELGTAHLASSVSPGVPIAQTLAAYNAGQSRVSRWVKRPGAAEDAELFTELIPFTETRDYVRVVLSNAAIYRGLYARS